MENQNQRAGQPQQQKAPWKNMRSGVAQEQGRFIVWEVLVDGDGNEWLSMKNQKGRVLERYSVVIAALTQATAKARATKE